MAPASEANPGLRAGGQLPDGFAPLGGLELEYPARMVPFPAWIGHIPFAFWIVAALRPRTIVELGVHTGNSYCAFLQAVQALGLKARCFGVDHWLGDEHAGFYGDEVYEELRAYHDPLYGTFSSLLRVSFDEALTKFDDGSIDLLHIDGLHTYEAASRDFTGWLPKMSADAVVMFHDTQVRERGFGIWRLWAEVAGRYPSFEFPHSHGLGVAYVGSAPPPAPLATLLEGTPAETDRIRAYFARLGQSLEDRFALCELETSLAGQRDEVARQARGRRALERKLEAAHDKIAQIEANLQCVATEMAEVEADHAAEARGLHQQLEVAHDKIADLEANLQRVMAEMAEVEANHAAKTRVLRQQMALVLRLQGELTALKQPKTERPREDDGLRRRRWLGRRTAT